MGFDLNDGILAKDEILVKEEFIGHSDTQLKARVFVYK